MASFSEIANKKVAGVPVLYLGLGFVAILAVVAYKLKPSVNTDDVAEDQANGNAALDDAESFTGVPDYSSLNNPGTVTVVQGANNPDPDAEPETNESWGKGAIEWLIAHNSTSPGDAQRVISKYLLGDQLSFEEGKIRDAALKEKGLPPDYINTSNSTSAQTPAPAQRQFTAFPGKHTVKNTNDNRFNYLSQLYYNRQDTTSGRLLYAANPSIPPNANMSPGTVVTIPAWREPRFYTATKTVRYFSAIAAKNGTTETIVKALNPGMANPPPVGTKVRVA